MSGIIQRNGILVNADMVGANMVGANMVGANMVGADMTGADMTRAYMVGAYMVGAYMARANMVGADMTGANMTGANMKRANMTGANCQLILRDDGRGYGVHVDWDKHNQHTYRAGCRHGFTVEDAREHWGSEEHESPEHAARILAVIELFEANIELFRNPYTSV